MPNITSSYANGYLLSNYKLYSLNTIVSIVKAEVNCRMCNCCGMSDKDKKEWEEWTKEDGQGSNEYTQKVKTKRGITKRFRF
ncbi:MAG: hypothetical protein QXK74_07810 [Candidatus Nitrosocaldaceae archaeon]